MQRIPIDRLMLSPSLSLSLSHVIVSHCVGQNIKSLAAYVSVVCPCARVLEAGFSRKRLEIEAQFQWDANRKWHMANRLVTWSMTPRDLERSRLWSTYIWMLISWRAFEIALDRLRVLWTLSCRVMSNLLTTLTNDITSDISVLCCKSRWLWCSLS